jgi:TetR/AcrR family transcriptional regulator, ethionamide resistance regulator
MTRHMASQAQRDHHRSQRASTRRDILDAAEELLRERPFREISVDAVMAEIGLTRTSFYRHFDDLTDLVLHLFEEVSRDLLGVAEQWSSSAGAGYPVPGKDALGGLVAFYVRHGPLMRAFNEAATADERIERAVTELTGRMTELAAGTMERLAGAGVIDVPDPRALAQAMTVMNQAYMLSQFGREPQADPALVLATLRSIWLRLPLRLPS